MKPPVTSVTPTSRLRRFVWISTAMLVLSVSVPLGSASVAGDRDPVGGTAQAEQTLGEPPTPKVGRGFVWGVAGSAFQSEGGQLPSNWHKYAAEGTNGAEPYLNSVDFRHRYPEDIRRARDLGVNTYRIGINWARVEPKPGVIDQAALRYYDDVISTIKKNGMKPLITLDHFVYPLWVLDQGAWDNPKTVDDFVRFSKLIIQRYHHDAHWWLVFNEPACYMLVETPRRPLTPAQIVLMYDHLVAAHRRIYDLIHAADPKAMVSSNECTPNLAAPERKATDALFLDRVADKVDFIGIDYYYRDLKPQDLVTLVSGESWKIPVDPAGLYPVLKDYHQRYPHVPIVVTENGMATDNGKPREDGWSRSGHLKDNVYWMQRAIREGVPVIGYFYWSLTDNYEWGSYRPRFGLYTVDVTTDPTLTRRPTAAVDTFRRLIRDGGVPKGYVPPSAAH